MTSEKIIDPHQINMTSKEIEAKRNFITNNTIKCKCGHSLFFKRDYDYCTWCGRKVYRNKQAEFRDKLSKEIKRKNKEVTNV